MNKQNITLVVSLFSLLSLSLPFSLAQDIIIDPNGPSTWGQFGNKTLVMDGTWMATGEKNLGVHLFQYSGAGYEYRQRVKPSNSSNQFGFSYGNNIAINGDYMIIGDSSAFDTSNVQSGAAFLYRYTGGTWSLINRISRPNGVSADLFGFSVDLYFNLDDSCVDIIIGAPQTDFGAANSGSAHIYRYDIHGGGITSIADVIPADGATNDQFGYQVAINKRNYAVSAPKAMQTTFGGAVYLGKLRNLVNSSYPEDKFHLDVDERCNNARFGFSIDMSDDILVVGAFLAKNRSKIRTGAVYVYDLYAEQLTPLKLIPSGGGGYTAESCFGRSVSVDGDYILTASYRHSGSGVTYAGRGHLYERSSLQTWFPHTTFEPPVNITNLNMGYTAALGANHAIFSLPRLPSGSKPAAGGILVEPVDRTPQTATIVIDYSLDEKGFFSDDNPEGPYRRTQLEWAAKRISSYLGDQLAAINPNPGQNRVWNPIIAKPSVSPQLVTDPSGHIQGGNLDVEKNEIIVFVGGTPFTESFDDSAAVAIAFPEADNFFNLQNVTERDWVNHRGQAGMAQSPRTDTSVWGRTVTFNSNIDWLDNDGTWEPQERSLYRTAMHELIHVLGFSRVDPTVSAFMAHYDTSSNPPRFTGAETRLAHGLSNPPPAMDALGTAHFDQNLTSPPALASSTPIQSVLLRPQGPNGIHEFPTLLDLAVLKDIGWEILYPPTPEEEAAFLQGTGRPFPYFPLTEKNYKRNFGTPGNSHLSRVTITDCNCPDDEEYGGHDNGHHHSHPFFPHGHSH